MKKIFSIATALLLVTAMVLSCKKDVAVITSNGSNYSNAEKDTPYLPSAGRIIDTPYLNTNTAVADTPYIK